MTSLEVDRRNRYIQVPESRWNEVWEMREWCSNRPGYMYYDTAGFGYDREEDLVTFLLRWS
jgi:hypothetical protein